jgi:hypothetical protein
MTPTARSLAECRRRGWEVDVVERRVWRKTRDFLGCIDLIAIPPGQLPVGIQATSGSNHGARIAKAKAEPRLAAWLGAGCTFAVWSWAKKGARGKRKRWTLREEGVR